MAEDAKLERLRAQGLEVLASLHRGGMGEVHLARKLGAHGFERWVAIKVIRPELARDDQLRQMFLDEARVLSHLNHPVIAQVQDFGAFASGPYLVMEYVQGLSLSVLAKKRPGPVPPPVAARMVAEVARGLHSVHEQTDEGQRPMGIVHRDISPQNIMISFEGRMKLLDFGIALMAERRGPRTSTGLVKGKITYVAPEQITGAEVDRRTDVYSLSIVLHELLTGAPLFFHRNSALAAAQERRRAPRPSRATRVPARLDRIVMRGLEMEPDQRWPDARSMAIALEEFATRAGGATVEAFAEAELKAHRQAHQHWLRNLGEEPGSAPPPPTESVHVSQDGVEIESHLIEAESREPPKPPPSRRRALTALGLGVIALSVVSLTLLAQPWNDEPSPPKPQDQAPQAPVAERTPSPGARVTASAGAPAAASQGAPEAASPGERPGARAVPISGDAQPASEGADAAEATSKSTAAPVSPAPSPAEAETAEGDAEKDIYGEDFLATPTLELDPELVPAEADESNPGSDIASEPVQSWAEAETSDEPDVSLSEPRPDTAGGPPEPAIVDTPPIPKRAPTARPSPGPSRKPIRDTVGRRPTRSRNAQPGWGRLTLRARPGAWVFVGGKPFGRTPLIGARIRAGRHQVALRRAGDTNVRWSSWVTVREDRHVRIRLR